MIEMLKTIQASDVTYRLGWTLLHSLWLGAATAALLALVLAALRGRNAILRYAAACAALGLLLAAMGWTYWLIPPQAEAPRAEPMVAAAHEAPTAVSPAVPTGPEAVAAKPLLMGPSTVEPPPSARASAVAQDPLAARVEKWLSPMLPWVVLGWAVGVLILSVWQFSAWTAARRLCIAATRGVDAAIEDMVQRLRRRLKISKPVKVLQSMLAQVPMTIGWVRPVILLPATLATGFSSKQLEMLLVHELAHIRRLDYLVNLVQTVVETLMFYHPAVWYIARRIRAEREHSCDDVALAVCGDRGEYAEALVACSGAAAAMAMAASGGTLLERLQRILGIKRAPSTGRTLLPVVLALTVMVGVIIVPLAILRGQSAPPLADQQKRVYEDIYVLRNSLVFSQSEETYAAVRDLVRMGKAAVPALCAELDRCDEKRDGALRTIAFTLRVIGDPRAVPALIRALPKTGLTSFNCGGQVWDKNVWDFVTAHPLSDFSSRKPSDDFSTFKYPEIEVPRADREILDTLKTLTKHEVGSGKAYEPRKDATEKMEEQRRATDVAEWQKWWDAHGKELVTPAEMDAMKVTGGDAVNEAGEAKFGPLFPHGAQAKLGPAREMTLPPGRTWDSKPYLNLATGKTYAHKEGADPTDVSDVKDIWVQLWRRQIGIDVAVWRTNPDDNPKYVLRLGSMDMHTWPVDVGRWDTIDQEIATGRPLDLGKRGPMPGFDQSNPTNGEPYVADTYPATFFFITREGDRGIMRIDGPVESPAGMKFRWRLFAGYPREPVNLKIAAEKPVRADAVFGAVEKVTLTSPASKEACALDLDTGATRVGDASLFSTAPGREDWLSTESHGWMAKWHGDIIVQPQSAYATQSILRASDMRVCAVTEGAWEKLTAPQALTIAQRKNPEKEAFMKEEYEPNVKGCWVFKTREGAVGILRVLKGTALSLTFEYKLVEGTAGTVVPATAPGAGAPATAATTYPKAAAFGPVESRILDDISHHGGTIFFTFKNGAIDVGEGQDFLNISSLRLNGIDLQVDLTPGRKALLGIDLSAAAVDPALWDSLTASELPTRLRGLPPVHDMDVARPPATYLFKTRANDYGIVQVTALTERPPGIKIRYRLLQQPAPPPATQPAKMTAPAGLSVQGRVLTAPGGAGVADMGTNRRSEALRGGNPW